MKKESRRWKVFLIVLCMLVTMMPATVFADDTTGQTTETLLQETQQVGEPDDQGTSGDVTPPEGGDPADTVTPPGDEDPADPPATTEDGITQDDPETTGDGITTENPPVTDLTPTDGALRMTLMTGRPPATPGAIEITKEIVNDPGANDTFTFDVWKDQYGPDQFITRASISGAGTVIVDNLASGKDYKVKEVNIPEYYTAADTEQKITLEAGSVAPVTFTNTYSRGIITINKFVENTVPGQLDTFAFNIYQYNDKDRQNPWTYIKQVSRRGAGILTVDDLSKGTYKVEEVVPANYIISGIVSERYVQITKENRYKADVTYTNCYTAGTITINKEVLGYPGSTDTFTFDVYKLNDKTHKWDLTSSAAINGSGSVLVKDLPDGNYQIIENKTTNYQFKQNVFFLIIKHLNRHQQVTFKNTYTGPTTGAITVTKHVESDEGVRVPITKFTFRITGPEEFSKVFQLDNGTNGSITFTGLTPGGYVITEDPIMGFAPEDYDYDKDATVSFGSESTIEFTNIYDPGNQEQRIIKDVAPYSGSGIPETGFEKSLALTELNKSVIYRIRILDYDVKTRNSEAVNLSDSYNRNGTSSDITTGLRYWFDGEFTSPDGIHLGETYYYIDTLTENGTYTNTVSLLGYERGVIASSSAVVVVNYQPSGTYGGGGGGGSHHNYYDVIYNSNFPSVTGTGGTVPVDSTNYSYNNPVNVKGNTGDLKAGDYVFKGWNTKPDGTGTMYQSGSIFNITADTVLYAIWEVAANETIQPTQTSTEPQPDDTTSAPGSESSGELDNVPKTGDATPLLLMLLLSILSIASIGMFGRRKVLKVNTDK